MNQKIGYIYGGLRQVTSDDRRLESTKEYDAYKLLQIASHHLCSLSSVNTINAYQTLKVDYRILIERTLNAIKRRKIPLATIKILIKIPSLVIIVVITQHLCIYWRTILLDVSCMYGGREVPEGWWWDDDEDSWSHYL